jgi:hypothetical protein
MPFLLIRHKVKDFAAWKPVFEDHSATRKAAGSKGGYLLRNHDDPNEVVVLLEVEDLGKARQFAQSADLKEAMQRAGAAKRAGLWPVSRSAGPCHSERSPLSLRVADGPAAHRRG